MGRWNKHTQAVIELITIVIPVVVIVHTKVQGHHMLLQHVR